MIQKLLRNPKYKVVSLCVILAATFWLFNAMNESYTTSIEYPLEIVYDDELFIETAELPQEALISVSGTGWSIMSASLGIGIEPYFAEVTEVSDGKFKVLGKDLFQHIADDFDNLKVNFVYSDVINFKIERKMSKEIRFSVIPEFNNERYQLRGPVQVRPDVVTVTGPESKVVKLPELFPLTIEGINNGQSLDKKTISLEEFLGESFTFSVDQLNITAVVDEFKQQEFSHKLKMDYKDAVYNLNLEGTMEIRQDVDPLAIFEEIEFTIDSSSASKRDSTRRIVANYPEDRVRAIKFVPNKIVLRK